MFPKLYTALALVSSATQLDMTQKEEIWEEFHAELIYFCYTL